MSEVQSRPRKITWRQVITAFVTVAGLNLCIVSMLAFAELFTRIFPSSTKHDFSGFLPMSLTLAAIVLLVWACVYLLLSSILYRKDRSLKVRLTSGLLTLMVVAAASFLLNFFAIYLAARFPNAEGAQEFWVVKNLIPGNWILALSGALISVAILRLVMFSVFGRFLGMAGGRGLSQQNRSTRRSEV